MVARPLTQAQEPADRVLTHAAMQTGVTLQALVNVIRALRAREPRSAALANVRRGVGGAFVARAARGDLTRAVVPSASRHDVHAGAETSVGARPTVQARLAEARVRHALAARTCNTKSNAPIDKEKFTLCNEAGKD